MCDLVTVWLVFGGAAYVAIVLCKRAARSSLATGIVARVLSSLGLWLLGCGLGVTHVATLSAWCAGNYQTWFGYGGWWAVLATGVVGGILPWLVWPRHRRTGKDSAGFTG
jgi:hypothetical protein